MIIGAIKNHFKELRFLSIQIIKKAHLETMFGIFWVFFQPLVFFLVFYFFFTFGLRGTGNVNGVPVILFLFAGNLPWTVLSGSFRNSAVVFWKNTELVKTVKFPVVILPLAESLATMYVHIIVMLVVVVLFALLGFPPSIYYLNFLYIYPMMIIFMTILGMLFGSISLFIQDTHLIISTLMAPMFWLTPILWNATGNILLIERVFNPFYYFIELYRDTLLYHKWFFEQPVYDIYIFIIMMILYLGAHKIYNKSRIIMADIV